MKKKILLIVIILLAGGFIYFISPRLSHPWQESLAGQKIDLPPAQNYQDFSTSTKEALRQAQGDEVEKTEVIIDEQVENVVVKPVSKNINLNVPFTSQAPLGDWAQPWQDACEEASVLMVDYYYQNKSLPSKEEVSNILKEMVVWQEINLGGHYNLTIAKLAEYIKATFNYETEIIKNLTSEKLKFYLNTGQPIIVPANGKKLANPNFKNGGPEYHMLVVKGYVDDKFITNDPGTRLGADFIYSSENLLDSIADWNMQDKKANGPKIGIIIKK